MAPPRWVNRPEGSNWGDFGPDDELGRLNLITPDKVLAGAKEVREGLSFCLSLPLDMPAAVRGDRFPPRLFATGHDHGAMNLPFDHSYPGSTGVFCDDAVEMCLQFSTQWDALSHVGAQFDADGDGVAETVYYNGWRGGEHVLGHAEAEALGKPAGAHRLGVETYAEKAIQSRGVLLDFERHFGPQQRALRYAELKGLLDADGIEVAPGDILCLHSGMARLIVESDGLAEEAAVRQHGAELDGSDPELLKWIADSGVAAIVADNFAVERLQTLDPQGERRPLLPIHELCLFKLGIPLGELWWLSPLAQALAERRRHHFLLTAPALRLPRAVGSPVTPVATI